MKIIVCHGLKGGVGRTTAIVNLAAVAAQAGGNVLLWDLDPQAASTYLLRVEPRPLRTDGGVPGRRKAVLAAIKGSDLANLDLLPADSGCQDIGLWLSHEGKSGRRLLANLAADYDYLFVDAPANTTISFDLLSRLADLWLVPLTEDPLCLQAYQRLNECLVASPSVLLMPFLQAIRDVDGGAVRRLRTLVPSLPATVIPCATEARAMAERREPVLSFAPDCPLAGAYAMLWWEVRSRLQEI